MTEETQREEQKELSDLICKNCRKFYNDSKIPENPWFLESQNAASPILSKLLNDSDNDPNQFSLEAAKTIIKYKSIELNFNISKASFLKETLEIDEALHTVKKFQSPSTSIFFKIIKGQSSSGPISIEFDFPKGKQTVLEEGDNASFTVSLNDIIEIKFFIDDGDNIRQLGHKIIKISDIWSDTYYLSAVQKPELVNEITKKSKDFEVKIEMKLKLSTKDRKGILGKRNAEINKLLNSSSQDLVIYTDLLSSLSIRFNEQEQAFFSLLRGRGKEKGSCFDRCAIF